MKRIIYVVLFVLPFVASAQNMYNMTGLFDNAPAGTARFVSMGGSMGALGGDLSVMGTNPAGTAIYRSSDFNLTGVIDFVGNNAVMKGKSTTADYTGAGLGNTGFLLAFDIDASPVKFVNMGVNFRRKAGWCNNFEVNGKSDGFSQQYVIKDLYYNDDDPFDTGKIVSDMYSDFAYSWLTLLAADAGIFDKDGNFLINPQNGTLIYNPEKYGYYSEERGELGVFDINLSANIDDRVYIGATLGYYKLDYSRYSYYYESDNIGMIYSLDNDYKIVGSGFDFKLGAIFRPFRYSPFKIAAFVHTPVFYSLIDRSSASMSGPDNSGYKTNSEYCYGDDLYTTYSLSTPWRFGAAASYTFGKFLAMNAEYEYADASTMAYTDGADIDKAQNDEIVSNLKPQHTLRFGAELSLTNLALRVGYNYISSAFHMDAYKFFDNATKSETSTEYINRFGKNVFTLGVGYTVKKLYFDVAYMYQRQNSEFYPYHENEMKNHEGASVKTEGSSLYVGIGIRF